LGKWAVFTARGFTKRKIESDPRNDSIQLICFAGTPAISAKGKYFRDHGTGRDEAVFAKFGTNNRRIRADCVAPATKHAC
jgi:hypothetical protein